MQGVGLDSPWCPLYVLLAMHYWPFWRRPKWISQPCSNLNDWCTCPFSCCRKKVPNVWRVHLFGTWRLPGCKVLNPPSSSESREQRFNSEREVTFSSNCGTTQFIEFLSALYKYARLTRGEEFPPKVLITLDSEGRLCCHLKLRP